MKMLFKISLIITIFLVSLLIFLPKEGMYNLLEQELAKNSVVISNETRKEKLFGLEIKDAEVYFKGINSAFIRDIDITSFLFYSNISVKTIRVSKDLSNFLPSKIDSLEIKHSILGFNKASLLLKGEFGEFNGNILIFERKIIGELIPSNLMKTKYKTLLNQFNLVEGKYQYEYKF